MRSVRDAEREWLDVTRAGLGRLIAALLAGAVAYLAWQRAYADSAYREGLGYTDLPAEDVPGRLEAYEEAIRRAPDAFTYRLRAGQILQARAEGRTGGAASDLHAASLHLRAAVALHPLDARARAALSKQLLLEGDVDAALVEARRAFELGPRHPSAQVAAVRVAVLCWSAFDRIDGLATALELDEHRATWLGVTRPPQEAIVALRAHADSALADLLEACAGDVERLSAAHRWCVAALPALAPVLSSALRRSRQTER